MPNHEKLRVWHRGNAFSAALHLAIPDAPWRGAPRLKSQLLRAASSIPANIGEGAGQQTDVHFAHFITIAIGSSNEVETHLRLAIALRLVPASDALSLLDELDQIRRMLIALRRHLLASRPDQSLVSSV